MSGALVLRDVEVEGSAVDVRVVGGRIEAVGPGLARPADTTLDGHGGALLPGLHDHHLHLMAMAAAARSVAVGPDAVRDPAGLAAALRGAAAAQAAPGWIRAVGYHESVAGDLDRLALDAVVGDRPVRVQHRTGARWILNSAAIDALDLDPAGDGRIDRADRWLRDRLPPPEPVDLAALGAELAGYGVTGVTDATPYTLAADLDPIVAAATAGALPQRVTVTGGPELAATDPPDGLQLGPVKVVLDEHDLPLLAALVGWIELAHHHGRAVAVHCVTLASLVLALAAFDEVGGRPHDRIEHGAVIPPDLLPALRRHHLTVVTQPGFVAERGDDYLRDVDADDRPFLYPCRSLVEAGVGVAGSTDAPYSDADPWRAIVAATTRTTPSGTVVGLDEALPAAQALALFLGPAQQPAGPPRRIEPRAPADLCLLTVPLVDALAAPSSQLVAATLVAGRLVHQA